MNTYPCHGCSKRVLGCHDKCGAYLAVSAARKAALQKKNEHNETIHDVIKVFNRRKRGNH